MNKPKPSVDWEASPLKLAPPTEGEEPTCQVTRCRDDRHADWPVCFMHAMLISRAYDELLDAHANPAPPPRDPFVYYLMVGPETVKIGTTKDLNRRLCGLRTEAQYVVAIERGSFEVETERHRQFAEERIGRREDFRLSGRLKAHIEALQPDRDGLVEIATATRKSGMVRKNGEFVAG